jgi:hypothetical protein
MSIVGFQADMRNNAVFRRIDRIIPTTREGIRRTWFEVGRDLKNEANKEILRKPKGGATYFVRTRGGRVRRHVASAPGETHANLSGTLRKSVSWKVHGYDRMDFGYGFATNASSRAPAYDVFVEDGTKNMAARPSIENAVNRLERNTQEHFRRAILREFERV